MFPFDLDDSQGVFHGPRRAAKGNASTISQNRTPPRYSTCCCLGLDLVLMMPFPRNSPSLGTGRHTERDTVKNHASALP